MLWAERDNRFNGVASLAFKPLKTREKANWGEELADSEIVGNRYPLANRTA